MWYLLKLIIAFPLLLLLLALVEAFADAISL
jgi:hypothetical protein